jgi:hypothetical protein
MAGSRAYLGTLTRQNHPITSRMLWAGRTGRAGQEWAEAHDAEHPGFYEHQTLNIQRPQPLAKILGTTTCTEYKTVNAVSRKRKARLCVLGNQQKEGELNVAGMMATEVRLLMAIAAKHGTRGAGLAGARYGTSRCVGQGRQPLGAGPMGGW